MNISDHGDGARLAIRPRLILIADQPEQIQIIRLVAERLGFDVRVVVDPARCRAYLASGVPTLVVLDLNVSDVVAVDIIRELQVHHRAARLMLFSRLDPSVLRVAEVLVSQPGLRVSGVIRKPIDPVALARQLGAARTELLVDSADLNLAITRNEIDVLYEPKVELSSPACWQVNSFEALARWVHPTLGLIPPEFFISLAELSGLIWPLSMHVVDRALSEFGPVLQSRRALGLSMNLPTTLLRYENLSRDLRAVATRHNLDPSQLILEVSEGFTAEDQVAALAVLGALRDQGFRISIDDFGAGAGCLTQFRRLPVGEVKVDPAYVRELRDSDEARVILELLIDVSRRFNVSVCAKGADSRSSVELLRAMGCDRAQGCYFGPPQPFESFRPLFRGSAGVPVELGR